MRGSASSCPLPTRLLCRSRIPLPFSRWSMRGVPSSSGSTSATARRWGQAPWSGEGNEAAENVIITTAAKNVLPTILIKIRDIWCLLLTIKTGLPKILTSPNKGSPSTINDTHFLTPGGGPLFEHGHFFCLFPCRFRHFGGWTSVWTVCLGGGGGPVRGWTSIREWTNQEPWTFITGGG